MDAPPARLPAGLRLRDARPEDAEALHALYHAAYAPDEDPHRPPETRLTDTVEDVRGFLRDSHVLVAEDDHGRIVGSIGIRRIANLRRLAVSPDLKTNGLGGALLEAAMERAAKEGFVWAMLDTLPDHPWLPGFYRKHGFEPRCLEEFPSGARWLQFRKRLD